MELANNYNNLLIKQACLVEAEAHLQKALETQPNHPVIQAANAELLLAKGDYQDALDLIESVAKSEKLTAEERKEAENIRMRIEQAMQKGKDNNDEL